MQPLGSGLQKHGHASQRNITHRVQYLGLRRVHGLYSMLCSSRLNRGLVVLNRSAPSMCDMHSHDLSHDGPTLYVMGMKNTVYLLQAFFPTPMCPTTVCYPSSFDISCTRAPSRPCGTRAFRLAGECSRSICGLLDNIWDEHLILPSAPSIAPTPWFPFNYDEFHAQTTGRHRLFDT